MPKALDLTGQRFGSLVALEKVPSQNHHTYWLCQCDCGNQKVIRTTNLTSGATKSCGCKRDNYDNPNKREIICPICGKAFISNNHFRNYCFECIPSGLTPTEGLRRKKRLIKQVLVDYKGGKCELCGYNKCLGALEFHHLNPNEKEFEISKKNLNNNTVTIEDLKKEADKCILVCANCHAELHYKD